jgi:hypothetical protein
MEFELDKLRRAALLLASYIFQQKICFTRPAPIPVARPRGITVQKTKPASYA